MGGVVKNLPWSLGPFDWIPAADPAQIEASKNDTAVRPIGVTLSLEDPRARMPRVDAQLPAEIAYHVSSGSQVVDIWLYGTPAPEGLLNSLLLGTHAPSALEAFTRVYAVALSLLSVWCFQTQRPMAVREFLLQDTKHHANWVVRPQAQTPIQLNKIGASFLAENPIGSLLALFREGMAATQPAYRFLCYYKILEAWHGNSIPFSLLTDRLRAKPDGPHRGRLVITAEMFDGKWDPAKYQDLIGRKFTRVFDEMRGARDFLAHPFLQSRGFVNLDDPRTLGSLSDVANVAERMALVVLAEEIRLLQVLEPDGTRRMVSSLVHESWGQELLTEVPGT